MYFRPDISFYLTGYFWPVVIGVCWHLRYPERSVPAFDRIWKFLSQFTPRMWRSGFPIFTIIAWAVFLTDTINIYVAASHLKRHAADQKIRSFGQILALNTVGTSVWDFYET